MGNTSLLGNQKIGTRSCLTIIQPAVLAPVILAIVSGCMLGTAHDDNECPLREKLSVT